VATREWDVTGITQLPAAEDWHMRVDGVAAPAKRLPDGDLRIKLEVGRHRVEVLPAP
jgi:hypothetical protein